MYAIVRCGGRQEKASVDDVLTVDLLNGEVGSTLTLPVLLVVDGDNVVTNPEELGGYQVAAEIIGAANGPKINIIRYKNKTGYRRRLGHRQHYTQVKITGITKGGKAAGKSTAAKSSAGKSSAASAGAARTSSAKTSTAKTSTAKTSAATSSAATSSAAASSAAKSSTASKAKAAAESTEES